jgi:hypothetical protein
MQDDVADASSGLLARGDRSQAVCIAGASYGGYATLNGTREAPAAYRCGRRVDGRQRPSLLYAEQLVETTSAPGACAWAIARNDRRPFADAAMLASVALVERARDMRSLLLAYAAKIAGSAGPRHGHATTPCAPSAAIRVDRLYDGEGTGSRSRSNRCDFYGRFERVSRPHLAPYASRDPLRARRRGGSAARRRARVSVQVRIDWPWPSASGT